MLKLFAAAIFLSAALLFLVQPMTGKVLLPLLGGSPAVWNTCMVFFQGILLLGYLYAHLVGTYIRPRYQPVLHAFFVLIAAGYLLFTPPIGDPGDAPTLWLIQTLLALVGLPFLAVSTTGPLLQRWFSRTDHAAAKDPYFLYAASNAGSLLGLIAYPTLIETTLTRDQQRGLWTIGFWLLVPLIVACGVMLSRRERPEGSPDSRGESAPPRPSELGPVTLARRARWVILAAVPSSLMLGVTQHISTDIAAIPLLWIGPLIIYLLSFIVAFSPRLALSGRLWGRIMPFTLIAALLAFLSAAQHPIMLLVALHLFVFLVAAMMCHTLLAEDRPAPSHLTAFYLCMSLGGVLGGSLNALVAPLLFTSILEYPLVIGAACLLRPQLREELAPLAIRARTIAIGAAAVVAIAIAIIILNIDAASTGGALEKSALGRAATSVGMGTETLINIVRAGIPTLVIAMLLLGRGSLRFALAATLALAASTAIGAGGRVLYTTRTFFGVNEVVTTPTGTYNQLTHGTTLHGLQFRTDRELPPSAPHPDADFRYRLLFGRGATALPIEERRKYLHLVPTTYYYPTGPIGDVMRELTDSNRFDTVALIGLGTGSLLAYARPNSTMHIYEIDPAVVQIAREPAFFRYIADAQRDPTVKIGSTPQPGDGRLDIAMAEDGFYRLIVIDAFTSDAVPIHLITSQAVDTYLRVLRQDGMIAFHVSSRYFDLVPVLGAIAKAHNLQIRVGNDARDPTPQELQEAKKQSLWVVLARTPEALGSLARNSMWENRPHRDSDPLWTDDFANPMGVFRGWWLPVQ